ncbi:MAG: ester cyclase [Pseudomonadota bacterium]
MSTIDIERARNTGWAFAKNQNAIHAKCAHSTMSSACRWSLSDPFNDLPDRDAYAEKFWQPLVRAMPDLERRNDIFVAGEFNGKVWVASTGHYVGTFKEDWLGIPATRQVTFVRFGEILQIDDDKIVRGYLLLDIVGMARQAGFNLIPECRGAELLAPPPTVQDGIRLSASSHTETNTSAELVNAMITGLLSYDQTSLESMYQEEFWDPNMMWYGPSGIGTARSLSGFQQYHQIPFLKFVPDRMGGNHVARFADGPYVASGGWPSIYATTSGADWISTPLPAGVSVTMRVMDFWRREGNLLKENWVFIDIPDLFRQCGINVFEELQ